MKLTRVLSTAMLLLLPAAIIPACAQEHEQEKQPEQKQQPAKPAQHQEQARPAPKPQQAQHEEHAKPAQQPQHAATRPQAKPAQQQQHGQQQASRGSKTAGAHGSIPEAKFRASFGSGHTFHVNRSQFANGGGRFQYGGFWFNVLNPWPVGWLYTDAVYVDYLNGGYFLCDPVHPGVYISINIG